jgi:hypothetical protein
MRAIQEGLEIGRAEIGATGVEPCASAHENSGASPIDKIGAPASPALPKRWVPHRKAEIVTAVRNGFLSLDEACERYALSMEEYLTWQRGIELFGLAGLRVNRTQQRRHVRPPARQRSADH